MLLLLLLIPLATINAAGILYPRDSETRSQVTLNGAWNFVLSDPADPERGIREEWYLKDLTSISDVEVQLMPVPSSYNDISTDPKVRDHVGPVWYDRTFFVQKSWEEGVRVFLRFGSVSYSAKVWVNGNEALSHSIGHLPFAGDVTDFLVFGGNNRITVQVDNTLNPTSIPQGTLVNETTDNGIRLANTYTFDFFNYAGIHRSVTLFTTPVTYIDDITVKTGANFEDNPPTGTVFYNITYNGNVQDVEVNVAFFDKSGNQVAEGTNNSTYDSGVTGGIVLPRANLWWPYLMDENPGYLYTLQVTLTDASGTLLDRYRLPVGIRTLSWNSTTFLLNNRPVYMRGFGRHEDADIRGKGFDLPTTLRDYNLIKWIGANAYRTSHYPYAEEIMDLADEMGIMIVDECPAVNLIGFGDELLENHKRSLTELYHRDKNRPSVVSWSIANEPNSQYPEADEYFMNVSRHVKDLDATRPITASINKKLEKDHAAKSLDIISLNRYYSWYIYTGKLDMIRKNLTEEFRAFHQKYEKPIMISEYGADTMQGYHSLPSYVWSEEFQTQMMSKHFMAFDELRNEGYFTGEFIWNFADFMTMQNVRRAGGNKKGIFTRDRQPKNSARLLRKRYWLLAKELDGLSEVPEGIFGYVSSDRKRRLSDDSCEDIMVYLV